MITAIISIIDRLIQLITIKENRRKSHFKDNIEPMMVDFAKVHNNYLIDFRKYRDMIINETESLTKEHLLFSEMKFDSKLSIHLRKKLWDWDMLDKIPEQTHHLFYSFEHYFSDLCFHKENEIIISYNRLRNSLYVDLHYLFTKEIKESLKKKYAEDLVEGAVEDIQASYDRVYTEFIKAKNYFLSPIKI